MSVTRSKEAKKVSSGEKKREKLEGKISLGRGRAGEKIHPSQKNLPMRMGDERLEDRTIGDHAGEKA